MNLKLKVLLGVVLLIGLWLRVWRIDINPPGLSWDEVSIGYNAYSLLLTGRDEHQRQWPLDAFAAYGDYKPPVAVYLTLPFVRALGLNELSVRLPSAILGSMTVLLIFLLVDELFKNPAQKSLQANWLALLAAGAMALSPWHINLSRSGFEANIALFFVVLGAIVLLWARNRPGLWLVVWLPFVVAIYTFNSSRYFVPLFALGLIWYLHKYIRVQKRRAVWGLVIAFVCLLPILSHLVSKEARLRFTEVNIFTDISVVQQANARIDYEKNAWWPNILQNRRVGYIRSYLSHFLDHFQPQFLFGKGDGNPKFSIQDVGQLYLLDAAFLVIGFVYIYAHYRREFVLLVWWLIVAIVPAAVARETPHALRILNSLPVWIIGVACGCYAFCNRLKGLAKLNYIFYILINFTWVTVYIFLVMYYLYNYHFHYPAEYSGEWQYGYKQAITYLQGVKNSYSRIVITDTIGRPYMYTLFYTKTDPRYFWQTKDDAFDAAGFYHVYGFGEYRFISGAPYKLEAGTLYVLSPGQVPPEAKIIHTVELLNRQPVLQIVAKS